MNDLLAYFKIHDTADLIWLGLGVLAQLMFSLRFIIQWLVSEKQKRSVIPAAFWWFSVIGGIMLLAYGIHRGEPIIMLGQGLGIIVYIRNLMLLHQGRKTDLPSESKS
ncbi:MULTISPECIES: lipid-A-disaccharide synthase N-terminal domain-containing protein [Rhizobium/Agrobacterium group]|uniref:Lipid A biosynthesis protein n=2 Tax=Rhizobium/Agrobacterium group TaxID=227290 RepID=B9JVJ5_ALLAM|nr:MULTISPECIES: lipid-A-disaccharide synthase N-terminal domain-containing protein [Rhizobium/Agrobacterium group]ACM36275.1 Lipid A biosynthesis protein [Allorhizobium ampelinum S4]MBF2716413.1 lipid-A-disaccharide synthase N-terminal domain-containing protein [Agrobacterium vitis]MCF1434175.1 lipid A biosynthesis protein [Allorhizobium ampelinum]MCF1449191.1 lipid A biosynthesis protein [Allorhizobium ampelinum]MCF1459733.1 lipid A biosynthesis protein [Allorhizobium ampelinum]